MISRSLEALLYRNHEERMSSMRGKDLPKQPRGSLTEEKQDVKALAEVRRQEKEQQRERIRRLYADGLTMVEVAEELSLSERQVRWVLERR
jgi:DNA-binding NarL/FixJ family response regulator